MGEQFDQYTEMVTTPDGGTFVVEARRPKLGDGDSLLVIRSVAGLPRWREVLRHDTDLNERVRAIADDLQHGRWPADT